MSLLDESRRATLSIPSIVITPALPSRFSISVDMRSALDAIIGAAPSPTPERNSDLDSNVAVVGTRSDDPTECDSTGDDAAGEVPHAPYPSQSAAAETHYLLDLNLEDVRFSMGDVLSALNATTHQRSSHHASATAASLGASSVNAASSTCGSSYVELPETSPYLDVGQAVGARPAESMSVSVSDASSLSSRRTTPFVGCPPTWRHAMYVSSLVWPAQRDDAKDDRKGGKSSRLRWCGVDILARTFGFKRAD
ncbi:hypothetical protein C8Q80DRAFT_1118571 [Daedaleopsis nitida]|nr:hypothetical protein C8Q80DRAFT_1118571 [Daedaleopsis nitida]